MEDNIINIEEFLTSVPPGKHAKVLVSTIGSVGNSQIYSLCPGNMQIHCDYNICNNFTQYECRTKIGLTLTFDEEKELLLHYVCRNCGRSTKRFMLFIVLRDSKTADVYKLGEYPQFGPPLPTRIFKLLGEGKELFLTGRRAENQGMGIGAFAYYRRVVENQKDRIFDEIIKTLKKATGNENLIDQIQHAKKETQFTKAIESIKIALPESLLFSGGHNPLKLLHDALSGGIHDYSDDECLELATSIREVLSALAEKVDLILKQGVELEKAIKKLQTKR